MTPRAAVMAGLLSLGGPALALPPHDPTWHSIEIWRQPQGLPQNTVYALLQTRDGYLWVGTKGGVSRFDGVRFRTYDDRSGQELQDTEVQSLAEGPDGSVWVATYGGGLTRIKDGRFTTYRVKDGLPSDFVWAVCADTKGGIWAGTPAGVARFADERFTSLSTRPGSDQDSVLAFHADPDGSVWMGTSRGALHRFQAGRLDPDVMQFPSSVRSLARDATGALWIGQNDRLSRLLDGQLTTYTTKDGLAADRVIRLQADRHGAVWIGTSKGLNRHQEGLFTSVLTGDLSQASVGSLYVDREDNVWAGFADQGLARLHQGQFVSRGEADGLPAQQVLTVFQDRRDSLWVGTTRGLAAWRGNRFVPVTEKEGLPERGAIALAQDREGRLWVSNELGVFRSQASVDCLAVSCVPRFERVVEVRSPSVRSIVFDHSGTAWLGSNRVFRYVSGRALPEPVLDGLLQDVMQTMVVDREGALWIATKAGVIRFQDGRARRYRKEDGLASDAIEGFYIEPDNTIWLATRQGLSRWKSGRLASCTAAQGLYSNLIHNVLGDRRGNLWLTSPKGIFRVRKQEVDDLMDGRASSVTSTAYGIEHGLATTVATAGYFPGVIETKDGRVWFATYRGVSAVDPDRLQRNEVPPPVHIEEVAVDQRVFDPSRAVAAPPGRGDIAIRYTGLTFLAAHKVAFKYKLLGYDRDWIDAGPRREAYYSNIPPGDYEFHVVAANSDGVWNEKGATLRLSLQPHFYQTGLFVAACALGLGLAVLGLHRLRVAHLRTHDQELRAVLQKAALEWEQTFDSIETPILLLDEDHRVIRLNRAARECAGNALELECLGQRIDALGTSEPWRTAAQLAAQSRATREPGHAQVHDAPTGRTWDVTTNLVAGHAREGAQTIVVARDVSRLQELQESLRRSELMSALGSLVAAVAHEVRNPLFGISANLDAFEAASADRPEFAETIGMLRAEVDRLAALMHELLDFGRPSSPERVAGTLREVVAEATRLCADLALSSGVEVRNLVSEDLPAVPMDRTRLVQVFQNAIDNALRHTPAGGAVTVEAWAEDQACFVGCVVRDSGPGLAAEDLARAFEPFYTRRRGGTGLGLAIVQRIVLEHGGTVALANRPEGGAALTLRLPCVATRAAAALA